MTVRRKSDVMKNMLHHHIQTKQRRHKHSIATYVYVQPESIAKQTIRIQKDLTRPRAPPSEVGSNTSRLPVLPLSKYIFEPLSAVSVSFCPFCCEKSPSASGSHLKRCGRRC